MGNTCGSSKATPPVTKTAEQSNGTVSKETTEENQTTLKSTSEDVPDTTTTTELKPISEETPAE